MPSTAPMHNTRTVAKTHESRATSAKRGYCSRWQKARHSYLMSHPLCVFCNAKGYTKQATVVDHIIPHKGDQKLFWDVSNWQSLCKKCHDSTKKRIENSIGRGGSNL